jgi:carboxylesterase type B
VAEAWAEFIKNGDAGGAGLSEWPAYQSPDYRLIEFGDTTKVVSNIGDPAVAFFEATPAVVER